MIVKVLTDQPGPYGIGSTSHHCLVGTVVEATEAMASRSFCIREENYVWPEEYAAFPGHARQVGGYLYMGDNPGLGIDVDQEKAAALLDPEHLARHSHMAKDRRPDGTVVRP